jgi:hypothetical protein
MKNLVLILVAALSLAGCATKDKSNTTTSDSKDTVKTPVATKPDVVSEVNTDPNATTIEWIDPIVKDLGSLTKNRAIEITYRFKNAGDKPLVIESVSASCGCTIPEKPEQPIAPGEEGIIKASFNGVGTGSISKQVHVVANTKPQKNHTLTFTGTIQE